MFTIKQACKSPIRHINHRNPNLKVKIIQKEEQFCNHFSNCCYCQMKVKRLKTIKFQNTCSTDQTFSLRLPKPVNPLSRKIKQRKNPNQLLKFPSFSPCSHHVCTCFGKLQPNKIWIKFQGPERSKGPICSAGGRFEEMGRKNGCEKKCLLCFCL